MDYNNASLPQELRSPPSTDSVRDITNSSGPIARFTLPVPLSDCDESWHEEAPPQHLLPSQTPTQPSSVEKSMASKRAEVEQQILDAFRQRQQQNKERQVQHLVLGKGLGLPAETTLVEGYYNPQKVLEPLTEEEKEMWEAIDLRAVPLTSDCLGFQMDEKTAGGAGQGAAEKNPMEEEEEEPELPFLEKFRCTYSPVKTILQARVEIEGNIDTAERELNGICSPFLFTEVLESLIIALEMLEEGHATAPVALPTCCRSPPSLDPRERAMQRAAEKADPLLLHGAEAVLQYVRGQLLAVSYALVPLTHTAQWVVQYTVAFLRSLTAFTDEEARTRLELLARCVRLVGCTENFSSVLLLLESKMEEYDSFRTLQESAEGHIGGLLDDVESTLDAVLKLPFPSRRARLKLVERGIKQKLQRAMLFLNEIDYHWTPNVRIHAEWKAHFLSNAFYHIHCIISPCFSRCLMGFIDDAVYKLVSDTRVSGKLLGASPIQPQVPLARQIEYERVTEGLTLQQVGMQVKGNASIVVGAQVCMGARYVLRQSTKDFNEPWGFEMDEQPEVTTQKDVEKFMAKVTSKARSKAAVAASARPPRPPASTTFLTQPEYD